MSVARFVTALSLILLVHTPLAAQGVQASPTSVGAGKRATAMRVPDGAIRVDGRLAEPQWERSPAIADFVQKEPSFGEAPTEPMEVHFVYDDTALYIGARMSKRPGSAIQAPMGRREDNNQSEHILVSLDTFLDRRTAFVFGVTAAGVRIDRYHTRDDEGAFDETWDPVWQAKTTMSESGWTAEFWIPFSQLRFTDAPEQAWGLNVQRFTPTLQEEDYWVAIPRTVRAWSSQFGTLTGISGLTDTRRIEISPYMAGSSTLSTDREPNNPFDRGGNLGGNLGADVKAGIGPNLTLQLTLNPDFGQVEADPAEVNLTANETFFDDRRPFFIENADLFNLQTTENFFYSRRVGANPPGPASGDYVERPVQSTILGAAKLTGRLGPTTSIGMLAAVTAEESARTFDLASGSTGKTPIAPRSIYAVSRIAKQFGASQSTASGLATFVHRDVAEGSPLGVLLARSALAVAGDLNMRYRGGEYEWTTFGGATVVNGDAAALARMQRNAVHFAQRPDRSHAVYDPSRTSIGGYWVRTLFARTGGAHWIGNATVEAQSPGLETNDVGRLRAADAIQVSTDIRYRETNPGRVLRAWWVGGRTSHEWTYGGEQQTESLVAYTSQTWRNFWVSTATYTTNLERYSASLTRGGPLMEMAFGRQLNVTLRNRGGSQTTWNLNFTGATADDGGTNARLVATIGTRLGPRWQLSVAPTIQRQIEAQQYIATLAGGSPATYGSRYVFGNVDRSTYSAQFRVGFTLKPDLNIDFYAEPFAASGRYSDIGELALPSTRLRLVYGTEGTTATRRGDGSLLVTQGSNSFVVQNGDFNVRSLRSNLVLRWEYRPGSFFFAVWQQNRRQSDPVGRRADPADMFSSFTVPGAHSLVLKTSFWLPI